MEQSVRARGASRATNAALRRPHLRFGVEFWPQWTTWAELRDAARLAAELGYDSIWTHDHLLPVAGADPSGPALEGWQILAAWAALTERIQMGLFVGAVTLREPALLAKMAATLDQINNGRTIVGLGAAWNRDEHRSNGIAFGTDGERVRRLEEAATVLRLLWTEPRPTYTGHYYQLKRPWAEPRPVRERLPLLIGGGGEKRTLAIAARHADLWHTFGGPQTLRAKAAVLHDHCAKVGRDPAAIGIVASASLVVRDDDAGVLQRLQEVADRQHAPIERPGRACGSPKAIADLLVEFWDVGVRTFIVLMPAPFDEYTLRRVITEVKPLVEERVRGRRADAGLARPPAPQTRERTAVARRSSQPSRGRGRNR